MKSKLDQIKAGADIHAGDGGYRLGTHEAQAKFAQARNQPPNRRSLAELDDVIDEIMDRNPKLVDEIMKIVKDQTK